MYNEEKILETVNDLQREFNELRSSYGDYISYGEISNLALMLYREKFTKVQADMIPYLSVITGLKISRDDRACRRKLALMTLALEGHVDDNGKKYSFSKAETLAPASDEYSDFMDERKLYYTAFTTITSMYNSAQNYIHAIASRL